MAQYKKVKSKFGERYLKDGKLIATEKVPQWVLERLTPDKPVSDDPDEFVIPYKKCLYDDKETKLSRLVNGQTIYLCEEHYYSETLGKIAQQLRERRTAHETAEAAKKI